MHTRTHIPIDTVSLSSSLAAFQTTFFLRQAYWCLYAQALHSAKNKIDVGGGTQWWDSQIIKLFRRQLVCICPPAILGGLFVESLKFLFEQYVYPCEKNWQPKVVSTVHLSRSLKELVAKIKHKVVQTHWIYNAQRQRMWSALSKACLLCVHVGCSTAQCGFHEHRDRH